MSYIQSAKNYGEYILNSSVPTSGVNGHVLTIDSTTPSGFSFAANVASVSAGTNIDVTGTSSAPVVNLQSPLSSNLFLGGVDMVAGDPTLLNFNSTTNATGVVYQSGGVGGGPTLASYGQGGCLVQSGTDQISFSGAGITNADQSVGTSSITNQSTPTQVRIRGGNNITGAFNASTLTNSALQFAFEDDGTAPIITKASAYNLCSSTSVDLNTTTGATATRTELIDATLASNQIQTLASSTQSATINSKCEYQSADAVAYVQALVDETGVQSTGGGISMSKTQAEISILHQDFPSTRTNTASIITGPSSSNLALQTTGAFSTGNITLSPGYGTDATLNYSVTPSNTPTNFAITSNRPIAFSSPNITSTPTNFRLLSSTTGGGSNPLLTLWQNDTNVGGASMRFYKNISTNGSSIGELAFIAKTAITGNPDREYARIDSRIRNNNTANVDGSIAFSARVNDVLTEIVRVNGVDNQTEFLQPIDMNANAITTSSGDLTLTCPTAGGSINLNSVSNVNITATGDNMVLSAGSAMTLAVTGPGGIGNIEFKPEATTGGIVFTGAGLQSNTSGPNSGEHLVITLNGVQYKIRLELP